jgi:hypothetical protein
MKCIKLLSYLFLFFLSTTLYGQHRSEGNGKLKSLKIGFITEKLDLSSKEAQGFWPVYNKHQEVIHQYRIEMRTIHKTIRKNGGFDAITNKQAENLLNSIIKLDSNIKNQEIDMYKNLKSILPSKKILILYKSEQDFSRRILEQLKKRREKSMRE